MKQMKPMSIDEAIELLLFETRDVPVLTETVPLIEAGGRYLGTDYCACEPVPSFARSLVDGYAIHAKGSYAASDSLPAMFDYGGAVSMAERSPQLAENQAIYVPTGGMLPEGADGVVMIENCSRFADHILVRKAIAPGENCSFVGEDIRAGECILKKGMPIGVAEIGALAALSIDQPEVICKPRVYLISTGDEIADFSEALRPGQIRDINTYTLYQKVIESGGQVIGHRLVKDDPEELETAMKTACMQADIILVSGGSSVGAKDYTQRVIEELSGRELLINGLLIKPGKPTLAGIAQGKLFIGLPGHPISCLRVFEALVGAYLERKYHLQKKRVIIPAILSTNFPSSPGKRTYQSVQLTEGEPLSVQAMFSQSAWISELLRSDGYIILQEEEEGREAGERVLVHLE